MCGHRSPRCAAEVSAARGAAPGMHGRVMASLTRRLSSRPRLPSSGRPTGCRRRPVQHSPTIWPAFITAITRSDSARISSSSTETSRMAQPSAFSWTMLRLVDEFRWRRYRRPGSAARPAGRLRRGPRSRGPERSSAGCRRKTRAPGSRGNPTGRTSNRSISGRAMRTPSSAGESNTPRHRFSIPSVIAEHSVFPSLEVQDHARACGGLPGHAPRPSARMLCGVGLRFAGRSCVRPDE